MPTSNFNLAKPARRTIGWHEDVNNNLDTINGIQTVIRQNQYTITNDLAGLPSVTPHPLGYNMGFDIWQRGTSFTTAGFSADMWDFTIDSGSPTVARVAGASTDTYEYGLRATGSAGDDATIINYVPYKPAYSIFYKFCQGKTVTFACDIKKSNSSLVVKLGIHDGIGTSTTTAAASTTGQRLVVNRTIAATATTLQVRLIFEGTGTAETCDFSNAAFSMGTQSTLVYVPINPQDDFFGCSSVYQLVDFDIGWYNRAQLAVGKAMITYPCPMLATPTSSTPTGGSGTSTNGSMSITFTPLNNLAGYFTATGVTKTGRNADKKDLIFALTVT